MRSTLASFVAGLMLSASAVLAAPPEPAILVLPFSSVAENGDIAMAKGVQQDIAANLAFGRLRIITPNVAVGATDAEGALKAARDANATVVIFGQSQTQGNQIRLTGEVLDVISGKPLGGLKVTGNSDDLFHMEDVLGAQAMWALPPSMRDNQALLKATEIATRMPDQPIQPASAPGTTLAPLPANAATYPYQPYAVAPAAYPTAPYYDPYYYPDYAGYGGYGYGGYGYSPLIVVGGFNGLHNRGFGFNRFGGFRSGFNTGFGRFHSGFGGGFRSGFGGFGSGMGGFHGAAGFGGGFHGGGGFGGHR